MGPLTELAREGARQMLAEALKAEADAFVANFVHERMAVSELCGTDLALNGRSRQGLVLWMSSGPRGATAWPPTDPESKIRFRSNILPKWVRRTVSLDASLPVLYLKGISTGNFQKALSAMMGPDAANLSSRVISQLIAGWQVQYDTWIRCDLSPIHYA